MVACTMWHGYFIIFFLILMHEKAPINITYIVLPASIRRPSA